MGHRKLTSVLLTGLLIFIVPLTESCTSLERQAYNTVVAAKAFIDAEKKMHPECQTTAGMATCGKLAQATSAKDALIDAAEIYCSGPSFEAGGKCEPPTKGSPGFAQAEAKLKAAIANYKQLELDIKGVKGAQ